MARISREYKVMLDQKMFGNRKPAADAFWSELQGCADRLEGVESSGSFNKTDKKLIAFLDTPDYTIRLNGFIFRQRRDMEDGGTEYTLKCRSPDQFIAAGADVSATTTDDDRKFEEDIGPPFVSRYSHSNTVAGLDEAPTSLSQAAELFPVFGKLERDGERCPAPTPLQVVNSLRVFEHDMKGPRILFDGIEAKIALILWSDGEEGRPLSAEFSFRYKPGDDEVVAAKTARLAMKFYEEVQRLDWCLPDARTKTQYAYRE